MFCVYSAKTCNPLLEGEPVKNQQSSIFWFIISLHMGQVPFLSRLNRKIRGSNSKDRATAYQSLIHRWQKAWPQGSTTSDTASIQMIHSLSSSFFLKDSSELLFVEQKPFLEVVHTVPFPFLCLYLFLGFRFPFPPATTEIEDRKRKTDDNRAFRLISSPSRHAFPKPS